MTGWYQVVTQDGHAVMTFVWRWEAEEYAAMLTLANKQYNRVFSVKAI
jgi:dsDNA-binding SOS-regulon protein